MEIENVDHIISMLNSEFTAMFAEFKIDVNNYLNELVESPVRSLADVIAFNNKFADLVRVLCIDLHFYTVILVSYKKVHNRIIL